MPGNQDDVVFPSTGELELPNSGDNNNVNTAEASPPDLVTSDLLGFSGVRGQRMFGHSDLETNEVNLKDLNQRVNLKSEMIDDSSADAAAEQLRGDSDLHASRIEGDGEDDEIGTDQQEQIQKVLQELLG